MITSVLLIAMLAQCAALAALIAYTGAIVQGQQIKRKGVQKYVARIKEYGRLERRHSSFYGEHPTFLNVITSETSPLGHSNPMDQYGSDKTKSVGRDATCRVWDKPKRITNQP